MTDKNVPETDAGQGAVDQTRTVGRGGLYLTMTKIFFIVASYAIVFGIPRAVGKERGDAVFGDYGAVNAWLSVLSTVLVTGTLQAISRFVGGAPHLARAIKYRGVAVQVIFGALVGGGFYLAAPHIAGSQTQLVTPMRVAAIIPFVYAIYSVFMGTLNGEKRFAEQALLDAGFTTMKVVGVLAFAYVLKTTTGCFIGFAAAAAAVGLASIFVTARGHGNLARDDAAAPGRGDLFRFQLQTVAFMLLVQWLVQMDLWYIAWFADYGDVDAERLKDLGESGRALYRSSQTFAQVGYALVVSVTFVLFPLISGASIYENKETARTYVGQAVRYAAIMIVGCAAILSSWPESSIGLLLNDPTKHLGFHPGGSEALRWLGLGYVAFGVLFLLCSVLNASGRPRASIIIAAVTVAVQAGLGYLLMQRYGLVGQSIATMVGMFVGLSVAVFMITKAIGPFLPVASLVRILIAGGVVYAAGLTWHPAGKVLTLGRYFGLGIVYLIVLFGILREFKAADFDKFKRVLPGRKK